MHGDLETAAWIYQEAIRIDETCAIAHYNLGMTFKAMDKFQDAVSCYQTALLLQPNNADIYQNLGVVWMKLGQIPKSLEAFNAAIALHHQKNTPESKAEGSRLLRSLREMGFQT